MVRAAIAAFALGAVIAGCGGSSHHTPSSAGSNAAGVTSASQATANPTAPPASVAHKAAGAAKQLSAGVVATVAGQPITLTEYQRLYVAETRGSASSPVPLDPPAFTRCAAAMARLFTRLATRVPGKSGSRPHIAVPAQSVLVKDCHARQQALKQGVMTQLIQQRWLADEAKAEGITVSTTQVNAALARQRQALGGAGAYGRYLARTGQSPQQASDQLRASLVEQQLQQRRLGTAPTVTDNQVAAYFAAHRAEFMLPHHPAPKLSTYSGRIRLLLAEQARGRRVATATTAFERRWRAQTICRPGYLASLCANAP
jgi:SurA N-terminal domain